MRLAELQTQMTKESIKPTADKLGIVVSGLCAIHCALWPLLLGVSVVLPDWAHIGHGWFWFAIIAALAGWSITHGWKQHHDGRVLFYSSFGLSCLVLAIVTEPWTNLWVESALYVIGGCFMVAAHWRNHRRCRCVDHHHTANCEH